jgi:hypothetical protein
MRKIIQFLSILIFTGCATQPTITPSPQPTPSASILPTVIPSPTPSPLPYRFPDVKGTFKVNTYSPSYGFDVSISLDEIGNGLIAGRKLLKITNFVIGNELIDFMQGINGRSTAVSVDKNGMGLIIWGSDVYGCTDFCEPKVSYIWGRKLENYLPVGDYFVVDESTDFTGPRPFLQLDENGSGKLIYILDFLGEGKAYYKDVIKFEIQKDRKDYTGNIKDVLDSVMKKTNKDGRGVIVYKEGKEEPDGFPRPASETIFFKKIENSMVSGEPVPLSIEKFSIKSQPVLALNQNGDGLAIWLDSFNGTCSFCDPGGASLYARYISNFNPQ